MYKESNLSWLINEIKYALIALLVSVVTVILSPVGIVYWLFSKHGQYDGKWFAWRPVETYDRKWVWGRFVDRSRFATRTVYYKLPKSN